MATRLRSFARTAVGDDLSTSPTPTNQTIPTRLTRRTERTKRRHGVDREFCTCHVITHTTLGRWSTRVVVPLGLRPQGGMHNRRWMSVTIVLSPSSLTTALTRLRHHVVFVATSCRHACNIKIYMDVGFSAVIVGATMLQYRNEKHAQATPLVLLNLINIE